MDTRRQLIVNQVIAQLQAIATANGFLTNVGASVFEWRDTPFQETELPALIFRDLDEPQELSSPRSERVLRSLHCLVQVVTVGDTPMRDIRQILADIEKAVGKGASDYWGKFASNTRPRIARAILDQESLKFAGSTFEFYIDYPTTAFNSFS